MLQLDDDDYDALGWGDASTQYDSAEWFQAALRRRAQVARARRKYDVSTQGREARARYYASERGVEANRRSSRKWLEKNRAKANEISRRFREKNPDYMKNYLKAYRARKKAEREQV